MNYRQPTSFRKTENQFIDLRQVLSKYVYHWPLFMLGLLVTFAAAYAYLQIANPVYEINSTILVKDEKKSPQEKPILQELDQSSSPRNAEAEIEILRSKKLISQVVNDLQLWTTYTIRKNLKTTDLYGEAPFKFVLLQKTGPLRPLKIDVLIKDKNTVEIKNSNGHLETAGFDKTFKNNFGKWKLEPTALLDAYIGSTVSININDPDKVGNDYIKILDAHLLDKLAPTIGLFLTDEVPERGRDVLNHLMSAYNEAATAEQKRTTKSTIDFIDNRLASLTGELNHAEKQVEGYRSSQGLTDITSQSKVYLENVQSNDNKLNEVNVQLKVIDGVEQYVNSSSLNESAPATIGITDPALNSLIEKLSQLQIKKVGLLATTPQSNPIFEPLDRQIRITRASIMETIRGIKASLLSTQQQLQSFNNKFESSIKNIPVQERQFVDMKRQQSIKENLYVYLLQKREELALSYASNFADARIVDQANVGDIKWPRKSLVFAIALICGLGLPFLIVYFRNSLGNKITDRRDIENATEAPVLGELSYEDQDKQVIILDHSHQIVAEQFRSLRTNLYYLHENSKGKAAEDPLNPGKVTLFTSSVSREGKSFVCSNLAASLAASGKRTVILETDLRKPKISSIFDLAPGHAGISDFLSSNIPLEKIIQPSGILPELDIIGSGYIPANPSELLERKRFAELIFSLRKWYDEILIDSPPLHLVTDAMIIARLADVSLYIVRQGHTAKSELNFINEVYQSTKLPEMHIVFNGIKKGKYGYGYNYDNSYYSEAISKQTFSSSLKLFLGRF